ncbi:MAG: hypothetical protein RLY14_1135 [Planctomycetota bacterium]
MPGQLSNTSDDSNWLDLESSLDSIGNSAASTPLSPVKGTEQRSKEPNSTPEVAPKKPTQEFSSSTLAVPSQTTVPTSQIPQVSPSDPLPLAPLAGKVDDDLPILEPLAPTKGNRSFASDIMASVPLFPDERELPGDLGKSIPAGAEVEPESHSSEYRIVCKTCGTPQYVSPRRTGKAIRCPDCYSEFKVPPPPPNWDPKAAKSKMAKGQRSTDDLKVADAALSETPDSISTKQAARDILQKAERESIDQELDNLYQTVDFDSKQFLRRNFILFTDPSLWIHALPIGALLGILFFVLKSTEGSEFLGKLSTPIRFIFGALCCGFLLAVTFACGTAVMEAAANKRCRITQWPLFTPGDWIRDSLPVVVACFLALAPGGLLGSLLLPASGGLILSLLPLLLSFWLLLPIFLISMLDNQSITAPISGKVLSTFGKHSEAWGSYYFKSALVGFVGFIALSLATTSPILGFAAGLFIPPAVFFYLSQLGSLGAEISDCLDVQIGNDESDSSSNDDLPA